MTTFLILKNFDHYVIVNDDADFTVGRVYPLNGQQGPYRVSVSVRPLGRKTTEAGIVKSLDDAIPAFLAYYEKYPFRWKRLDTREYWKETYNAFLRVKQDEQGDWLAYRDNYPLLREGEPARFASYVEAQCAADAHELDLYPNATVIDDGFSWLPDPEIDWRSFPHRVEERADWQRRAASSLP